MVGLQEVENNGGIWMGDRKWRIRAVYVWVTGSGE